MPNRIIKESICYSDDLDKLTPFEETVFYRLLVRVDDYGRIDARPGFLKSMLFVTKQGITEKNINEAVAKLASLGLVRFYEVDGKSFLTFSKWHLHQRVRNSKEKYPAPQENDEENNNSRQVAADCGELPPESNPYPNPNPESKSNNAPAEARDDDLEQLGPELRTTVADWLAYKAEKRQVYKPTGRKSLITEIKNNAVTYGDAAVVEVIRQSMGSNYSGIVWDRLKNQSAQHQQPAKKGAVGNHTGRRFDYDALARKTQERLDGGQALRNKGDDA